MNPLAARVETLRDLFEAGLEHRKARHVEWRDAEGRWQGWSTDEYRAVVEDLAGALRGRGLVVGDRVAILSRNAARWAAADYALVTSSFVTVPIYPTLAPDQVRYIVDDSGARGLFLEDGVQLVRLSEALEGSALEWIVLLSDEAASHPLVHGFTAFAAAGRGAVGERRAPEPQELASIIYTSGTTGRPKGVMLSHRNLVSNAMACDEAVDLSGVAHRNLSLLPVSHVFQRIVDYLLFLDGAAMAYCPDPHEAISYVREWRPTFFAMVPRLYEKIAQGMTARLAQGPAWKQKLSAWALDVGKKRFLAWLGDGTGNGRVPLPLSCQHAIADRLVLSKLRGALGGRIDVCFSGGGPLTADLHLFFRAIGLNLLPGYGLTETSPVLCTNRRRRMRLGTVGPALPGVELRLAEDGELLARGPNIMMGYWNLPDETAATIEDGWLRTGDLARIDAQGFVSITGRKKEILVLTTGKKVVPAVVEDRILGSPLVAQCVLVGDERKFVAALVLPDWPTLRAELAKRSLPSGGEPADLARSADARRVVQESVAAACASLADFERPKTVALLPRELSQDEGELTPTLKVKRKVVAEKWKPLIDSCYGAKESA